MKIMFTAKLSKFGSQGEKTGWTYLTVPSKTAEKLKSGFKRSFRVKGQLDDHNIEYVALIPMGGGDFILPVNAVMRKALRKQYPASVEVILELDESEMKLCDDLLQCLNDEPAAKKQFQSLARSHQHYYSKWIESSKTEQTRAKRIALAVNTLARKMNYAEMLQSQKKL